MKKEYVKSLSSYEQFFEIVENIKLKFDDVKMKIDENTDELHVIIKIKKPIDYIDVNFVVDCDGKIK